MANIDYEECRKIGDSIHIQFTNGESWLIPLDDIVGDIEEQRQIAKLEIMLDVCKRDKDALRYQLEEARRSQAKSRRTKRAPDRLAAWAGVVDFIQCYLAGGGSCYHRRQVTQAVSRLSYNLSGGKYGKI